MSEQQERETEEDEGGTSDTAPMLPRRRPTDYRIPVLVCPGWPIMTTEGLRTLLLPGRALVGFLCHLLLPGTVFLLVLLPAAAIVYLGFLCHSRALLGPPLKTSDPGSFLTTPPPWCIPVRPHASTVRRFIQPRVHGAERCSPIAALPRSSCSDSSPCRLSWCSPPPPAPSWSGDYALSCLPRRGPPKRAAHRDAAKRNWRAAALTKRNNSVPGSDASETSPCREPPLDSQKVGG
ncbi:Transmembrane protein 88B [Microtus ochrogaster]|uniref:Transmembrane protein 88B n=1 Tax=Microtus ochrogaster TaxID=79684 RepID=A0A8J6L5M3_MICOH|nr:Transmembrane protein 88B [Microtus ochrogaster]